MQKDQRLFILVIENINIYDRICGLLTRLLNINFDMFAVFIHHIDNFAGEAFVYGCADLFSGIDTHIGHKVSRDVQSGINQTQWEIYAYLCFAGAGIRDPDAHKA